MRRLILTAAVITAAIMPCKATDTKGDAKEFTITSNPIIRNRHTSDPAPLVVGNRLYLYTGHDQCYEDKPGFEGKYGYNLTEWLLYSTEDMVHWKDHGVIMKPTDFKYAIGEAWASQVIEYKGKYYFFTSMQSGKPDSTKVIGVAVSDSPEGPFVDHIGKPLVTDAMTDNGARGWWNDIDPTVLIDDDGSAWMSWGNGTCFLAKLTPDLKGIDGKIRVLDMKNYVEGPWLHKRNGMYYLTYASMGRGGECIEYATATSLDGEWTSRGPLTGPARDSFTIHPGIAEFKNNWYLFYHNGTLAIDGYSGGGGRRSVCVDKLNYNEDGTMKFVSLTSQGVAPATPQHNSFGGMPISQLKYNADPSPVVFNDTIFLYTSHDEDDADNNEFKMLNWILYTTTDMVNFTEHGVVASLDAFKWCKRDNGAWAQQVVKRNGKYYMYCPLHGNGIGVLVSDSPYGPFVDPIGKPLVWQKEHWEDIDPTILIDDDGQAYMSWGNPNLYCVKLNKDMISTDGEVMKLKAPAHYQEGPWAFKRDGKYYLAYASTCCPEGLGYATAPGPMGPWTFKGYIMAPTERDRGNHPGVIDYKGKSYIFGQNYDLLTLDYNTAGEKFKHHERRSVSVAEMKYDANGNIEEVPYWLETKVTPIESFNPYNTIKASTMAWGYRMVSRQDDKGIYVCGIDDADFINLKQVDFGKGASRFTATVSDVIDGSSIEIRLDSKDGPLVGTLNLKAGAKEKAQKCKIKGAEGVHDLFFVFHGPKVNETFKATEENGCFKFRNWKFDK